MSRNRFVKPETVRLPLSDEDWIDVKRSLTYGEAKRAAAKAFAAEGVSEVVVCS